MRRKMLHSAPRPPSEPYNHLAFPNFRLTEDFGSGTLNYPFHVFNDAKDDYNRSVVDYTGQVRLTNGATSMFTFADGKNVSSPSGMALFHSTVPYSSINTYSGWNGLSDVGAFETQRVLSDRNLLHGSNELGGHVQQQRFDTDMPAGKMNMLEYKGCSRSTQSTYAMALPLERRVPYGFSRSSLRISHELPTVSQVSKVPCKEFSAPNSTILGQTQPQLLEPQQTHQLSNQPYMQSYGPPETEAKRHFTGQDETIVVPQTTCEQSQLPSEESYADLGKQKILLRYVNYQREMMENSRKQRLKLEARDFQRTFVELVHSNACKRLINCPCIPILTLVSHFDACDWTHCSICSPVRLLSEALKPQKRYRNVATDLGMDFNASDDSSGRSCVPPMKRSKIQSSFYSSSSNNGDFSVLNPLIIQPCDSELTSLKQFPESHAFINSNAMEVNVNLVPEIREDPKESTSIKETGNNVLDNFPGLAAETCAAPSGRVASSCNLDEMDIVSSHELEKICFRRDTDIADHVKDYSKELAVDFEVRKCEVRANMESKLEERSFKRDTDIADHDKGYSKELGADSEVRKVEVRANMENKLEDRSFRRDTDISDHAKDYSEEHGVDLEGRNVEVKEKFSMAKPDIGNKQNTQESDSDKEINIGSPSGVSLTDFFTAKQLMEHMSSLLGITQSTSRQKKGNAMTSPVNENSCQLCEEPEILFAPPPLYCSLCTARVKNAVIYYSTPEEIGIQYSFCSLCYKESRGGSITVNGVNFLKAKLVKKKNDGETEEPWVECGKCKGWQHQICALFNSKKNVEGKTQYMCPKCCLVEIQSGKRIPLPKTDAFGAKDLPRTILSDHLEQRLFRRLQEEREEKAKATGKDINEIPEAEGLTVRVVLSVDKRFEVKKQLLDIFNDENYPAEFTYRSKVILLFQKIEGVDVCLFVLYVQEFGSECGHPNHRCAYISYLDSVKYFRPERETVSRESLRTFVYHEILLGYLEYCKKRGFASCYLWACPPVKGENYIFYCHPEIQKTPKTDKLRHWYHSMLRKAAKDGIVVDFTNLYDHFFVPSGQYNSKVTAARLPYFEGEYWSGAAEKIIKKIEEENLEDSLKKVKKMIKKRSLRAMGHADPSAASCKDILLMNMLGDTISPIKEDFIVVHLQFVCASCGEAILSGCRWCCSQCKNFQLCKRCYANGKHTHTSHYGENHILSKIIVDNVPQNTEDKDAIIDNSLFGFRHEFLDFCQENNYQFDTLRRAKHSTMMILYHLRPPAPLHPGTTCSICDKDTGTKHCWLCGICPNYIVCDACYQKVDGSSHKHRLTRQSSVVDHVTEHEAELPMPQRPTLLSNEVLNGLLIHSSLCLITTCSYPNCCNIKRLFRHPRTCSVRASGGCDECKKVWHVLRMHSRICKEAHCAVPRCRDLKKHAKQSEAR